MPQTLNARSVKALAGVHPDMIRIIGRALELSTVPFIITEGLRTLARQKELYAQGRDAQGKKIGRTVTDTLRSRHLTGHAVDLAPTGPGGSIDWNDRAAFDALYKAMMAAAIDADIPLRSGMDWDRDGNKREKGETDSPHYELPATRYP